MTKSEIIKVLHTASTGEELLALVDKIAILVESEQQEQEEPVAV